MSYGQPESDGYDVVHPECPRCGRYLTAEEHAAAEAGEGDGLCEACAEREWHAAQEVA